MEKEKKKNSKKIFIIVVIVLLVFVGFSVKYILNSRIAKEQEENIKNNNFKYGNNNVNLLAGEGKMAFDDDYIYLSNNSIYKISKQDKTMIKIINGDCTSLNIYNNKLYYFMKSEEKIYVCDLDGNNRKMLLEDVGGNFVIQNDLIYYISDSTWKDEISSYNINDEKISYVTGSSDYIKSLSIIKNKMYFLSGANNEYYLYEYDIYSKKKNKLTDDRVSYMLPTENNIFFINETDGALLYKYNTETKENTKINIKYNSTNGCTPFIIYDNFICVKESNNIILYNANGKVEKTIIAQSYTENIKFIDNNTIYGELTKIYREPVNSNYYVYNNNQNIVFFYYDIGN